MTPRWKSGYVNDEHWRVYFITDGEAFKIGYSCDPLSRLADLQAGSSRELSISLTVPGGPKLEAELHRKFGHLRIRREWFAAGAELVAHIDELSRTEGALPRRQPEKRHKPRTPEADQIAALTAKHRSRAPQDVLRCAQFAELTLRAMTQAGHDKSEAMKSLARRDLGEYASKFPEWLATA